MMFSYETIENVIKVLQKEKLIHVFNTPDSMPKEILDAFYENFSPDDWDFVTVSRDRGVVEFFCESKKLCNFEIKEVDGFWGKFWMGVNYHS
jgi:hypothetical protein